MAVIHTRHHSQNVIRSKGYTILEVLIVISILGVIMPAIFSILFVILQQQLKINEIVETKRQGDYILGIMKEKIQRDAKAVTDWGGTFVCTDSEPSSLGTPLGLEASFSPDTPLRFRDNSSPTREFWYEFSGGTIRLRDETQTPAINAVLNSPNVEIFYGGMECDKGSSSANPVVSIQFRVTHRESSVNENLGITSLDYQTKIKLQ